MRDIIQVSATTQQAIPIAKKLPSGKRRNFVEKYVKTEKGGIRRIELAIILAELLYRYLLNDAV